MRNRTNEYSPHSSYKYTTSLQFGKGNKAEYNSAMSNFYTRTGDDGFTGLLGEGRVPKYHLRTEAVGEVDEATAAIGAARAIVQDPRTAPILIAVQKDLYGLMAEIAATPETADKFRTIVADRVKWLESQTDLISEEVPVPREFILPGDSAAGGMLALARTIVRRAERRVAELLHSGEIENPYLLQYLNRLSSLCFILELLENRASGKFTPSFAKE